jgi:hypothetical protein
MKLNPAQVEETLSQFEAQVIPDDHPPVSELNQLFGDHTFFLDKNGLNVVEPNENTEADASAGTVTNLANWGDAQLTIRRKSCRSHPASGPVCLSTTQSVPRLRRSSRFYRHSKRSLATPR